MQWAYAVGHLRNNNWTTTIVVTCCKPVAMQRLRERPKELDLKDFTSRSGPTELAGAIAFWVVFLCTSLEQICKRMIHQKPLTTKWMEDWRRKTLLVGNRWINRRWEATRWGKMLLVPQRIKGSVMKVGMEGYVPLICDRNEWWTGGSHGLVEVQDWHRRRRR